MGDVLTLIEKSSDNIDIEKAKELEKNKEPAVYF